MTKPLGNRPRLGPSVFLAYSRADQEIVREFYRLLRLDGFQPWFDEACLIAGQDWQLEIETAVRGSDAVAVFLSHQSIDHNGYIHQEMTFALDTAERSPQGSIFLIPIRLDDVTVPSRLKHLHWPKHRDPSGGIGGTYLHLQRALTARAKQLNLIDSPPTPPDSAQWDVGKGGRSGSVEPLSLPWEGGKSGIFGEMMTLLTTMQGGPYLVHGRNPSGDTYVGTASLRFNGSAAVMEAQIRTHVLKYSGLYDGELLSLSGAHLVTYDARSPNGILHGSWDEGGVEELIPASPFAESAYVEPEE